jgi:GTPase SAR1 family protein
LEGKSVLANSVNISNDSTYDIFTLTDGSIINVIIYDYCQDMKKNIIKLIKNLNAIVLVYDVTNSKSFDECKNFYIKEIKDKFKSDINVILVGNKTDLLEKKEISFYEGEKLALENNYFFMETSCLNNWNVFKVFEIVILTALSIMREKKYHRNDSQDKSIINDDCKII